MERIQVLCSSTGHEERVAGVLLLNKLLEADSLTTPQDASVCVSKTLTSLGNKFIFLMLETTDHKGIVRGAALSLIAHTIRLGCDTVFHPLVPQLVELIFRSIAPIAADTRIEKHEDIDFLNHLTVTFKWLFARCDDPTRSKSLEAVAQGSKSAVFSSPESLVWLMQFIEDIAQVPGGSGRKLHLSPASAEAVCVLMYRGLHGSATESLRDSTLAAIFSLLCPSSCVASSWSLAGLGIGSAGKSRDEFHGHHPHGHSSAATTAGKFAMLLCSLIGGEVHLLLEEAIALHLPNDLSNAGTAATVADEDRDGDGGISDTTSKPRQSEEVRMKREVCMKREQRVERMLDVCLSLVHVVCGLLLGGDDNSADEIEAEAGTMEGDCGWTTLPAAAMLHIQQAMHSVMKKIFDFLGEIKDAAIRLSQLASDVSKRKVLFAFAEPESRDDDKEGCGSSAAVMRLESSKSLQRLVQRSAATLSLWVAEDGGLHDPFLDALQHLLKWSSIPDDIQAPLAVSGSYVISDEATTSTWTMVSGTLSMIRSSRQKARESTAEQEGLVDDEERKATDVLMHTLPALSAIINESSVLEDDGDDPGDSSGADIQRSMDVLKITVEKLSSCEGLFGRLVNTVNALAQHVVSDHLLESVADTISVSVSASSSSGNSSRDSKKLKEFQVIRELCLTGVRACEVLAFLLRSRGEELRLLRKSESGFDEAISQLFLVRVLAAAEAVGGSGGGSVGASTVTVVQQRAGISEKRSDECSVLHVLVARSLAAADYIESSTVLSLGPSSSSSLPPSSSSMSEIEEASLTYDWEQLSQSFRELVDAVVPILRTD